MKFSTNYKVMYVALIILISFFSSASNAQPLTPDAYGLKHFQLDDDDLGPISFYLDTVNLNKPSPLFLDINGSGGLPLCLYIKSVKASMALNTFNTENLAKTQQYYHYIILDKPGTPFCDSLSFQEPLDSIGSERVLNSYPPSASYQQRLSLDWRVAASKKVLNWLIAQRYWDQTTILAYGYSEGAQVTPALALAEPKITHMAALAGSGLNQLYDPIVRWRIKANQGEVSHQTAQDSIDAYYKELAAIYANPEASDRFISGHTYKRWASFGNQISLEQLKALDIPLYIVAATADQNSPIYSLDYIPLEFLRLGKKNLTYKTCVGCNHWLGGSEKGTDYLAEVLQWVDQK